MQDQYVAPELKLSGEAADVVLGIPGPGEDLLGDQVIGDLEFQQD